MPAVAGLTAVGTLMDEDEDAEEKRRCCDRLRRGRSSGGERKIG